MTYAYVLGITYAICLLLFSEDIGTNNKYKFLKGVFVVFFLTLTRVSYGKWAQAVHTLAHVLSIIFQEGVMTAV